MEEKIVFGGGCFWCTEAMFREIEGVSTVISGYCGGETNDPTYYEVCNGTTGHAEVIEITYDPTVISFDSLVKIHLTTHDPTTLNRQGADVGTQYRSVVFYGSEEEKEITLKAIAEIQLAYDNKIVTDVTALATFFEAESNHQDYYNRNSFAGYCQAVIDPKLSKFRKLHSGFLKK